MECCQRTEADKKGGHLALRSRDKQLVLRESAQCAKSDEPKFQDVTLHKFFNTNNLWVRLDLLKQLMDSKGGFVPLPTILNSKTVDPQLDTSTPVFQLEVSRPPTHPLIAVLVVLRLKPWDNSTVPSFPLAFFIFNFFYY